MNEYRINAKTNKCFEEYINERIKQIEEEKKEDWGKNQKKLVLFKKQYELLYEIENSSCYYNNCLIDNFIDIPFLDEEDKKTQTFLFFGDNQMEKTQIIILFIKNFIDLSENEMINKFNYDKEQITIYYIRAYNPQSYIKIIDIPIFNINRNDLKLLENIKNKINENVSKLDNIFLLFKDDRVFRKSFLFIFL